MVWWVEVGERGDSRGRWTHFAGHRFIKRSRRPATAMFPERSQGGSAPPPSHPRNDVLKLFVYWLCSLPHVSRHMSATFRIIGDCMSCTRASFSITPISCHTCQINGICRSGEVTTSSRRTEICFDLDASALPYVAIYFVWAVSWCLEEISTCFHLWNMFVVLLVAWEQNFLVSF